MSSLSAFSAFQALSNSRRNVAEPVYRYVAPTAMGAANGLTPEDAIALADINALIAANRRAVIRLRADQGDYSRNAVLPLSAGGVKIRGWHPTDPTARAVLLSDRPSPFIPKGGQYNGQSFFRLNSGADDIRFGNIDPSNIGNGFVILGADISGLILEDMDAVNLNRFLDTNNGALSNAIIRRCTGFGYEKGFIRLQGNSHDVLIEDIGGDSDENDDEPFCIGIALGGTAHDITIRRVSSINIVSNVGPTTYWNGDGFTQENGNYNIFYDTCYAAYCSDGGFDLKNISRLLNCNAVGCKRNYRFWTGHFIATNCRSENPISKGGTGDTAHFSIHDPGTTGDIFNPIVIATPGNFAPVFKFDADDCTVNVYGHDNITLIEGQPMILRDNGVDGSEVIFDPPLPTIDVSLVWRAGYEDGDVPRDTAEGTPVADLVTTGTSPASLILRPALADAFVLDGSVVRVGSALAGAAATTMVIEFKAHHDRWIVSAEGNAVATLGELAYDVDAQTWFERSGGVPANPEAAIALNTFVATLKAADVWDHMVLINHAWADSKARLAANMTNKSTYDLIDNVNANGQVDVQIPGYGGRGDFSQRYKKTAVGLNTITEIANTDFAMGQFMLTNFRSAVYGGTATGVGRNELPLGISPRPSSSTANLGTFATQLPAPAVATDPGFYAIEVNGLDYATYGPDGLIIPEASGTLNPPGGAVPAQIPFDDAPIRMYGGQAANGACYLGFTFTATHMGAIKMLALRDAAVALQADLRAAYTVTPTGTVNLLPAGASDDFTHPSCTKRAGATVTSNTDTHPDGFLLDTVQTSNQPWSGISWTVHDLTVGRYYCFNIEGISIAGSLSIRPYCCNAADAGVSLASYRDSPNVLRIVSAEEGPQILVFQATDTSMEIGVNQGYPVGTPTPRSWRLGRAMLNEGVEPAPYVAS
jgi:hypothetical protein